MYLFPQRGERRRAQEGAARPTTKGSIEMTRNLKALGLALVATMAFCAVVASAASADEFKAESAPVTLTGIQDPGTLDKFTTTAGTLECEKANYTGTQSGVKSTSVVITPVYSECFVGGAVPAIIHMNGCSYKFTLDAAPATTGTVHVECPTTVGPPHVTHEITITVGFPTVKCTLHVHEQTIGGIIYTNVGAGATREITVDVNATGLTYTETAGTGLGACTTSSTQHTGTYVGKATITGEKDPSGVHVGVFVS
jgi:energy-converting hydrogenase Eha subunit B